MFSAFFVLFPLLSISLFYKKSKSIGLQLRLNDQEKKFKNKILKTKNFALSIYNNI
jgi:hypothetical protein